MIAVCRTCLGKESPSSPCHRICLFLLLWMMYPCYYLSPDSSRSPWTPSTSCFSKTVFHLQFLSWPFNTINMYCIPSSCCLYFFHSFRAKLQDRVCNQCLWIPFITSSSQNKISLSWLSQYISRSLSPTTFICQWPLLCDLRVAWHTLRFLLMSFS